MSKRYFLFHYVCQNDSYRSEGNLVVIDDEFPPYEDLVSAIVKNTDNVHSAKDVIICSWCEFANETDYRNYHG